VRRVRRQLTHCGRLVKLSWAGIPSRCQECARHHVRFSLLGFSLALPILRTEFLASILSLQLILLERRGVSNLRKSFYQPDNLFRVVARFGRDPYETSRENLHLQLQTASFRDIRTLDLRRPIALADSTFRSDLFRCHILGTRS